MKDTILLKITLFLIFSLSIVACNRQGVLPTEADPLVQKPTIMPSPSPSPEPTMDYRQLSQEVLAALIDEAIVDANGAADVAATTILDATSDKLLTEAENTDALAHVTALQAAIGVTIEMIDAYHDQYSEITDDTIGSLAVIDESLTEIGESVTELHLSLVLGNSNIAQLSKDIALIETKVATVQTQSEVWLPMVQTQIDNREKLYANIPAQTSLVTYNRVDAFTQAHDFLDAYTTALEDGKFSSLELATISQLAVNAKASLYNTGDHQLMPYAQQINVLARNASRGEWLQASSSLMELKFSLPARPRP